MRFRVLPTVRDVSLSMVCLLVVGSAWACAPVVDRGDHPDTRESADSSDTALSEGDATPTTLRIATFNTSLSRDATGKLVDDLAGGDDTQAKKVAEILQIVRPDVVLLNEFDRGSEGAAAHSFDEAYLSVSQDGASPLDYPHRYVPKTNTGVHSGVDLNGDGETVSEPGADGYGDDAYGFGEFPGQYGMVVYSRFSIVERDIRTFREFLWKAMPDNQLPTDFYSSEAVDKLRLSSKNHVDLPIRVAGRTLHVLASHPTPPAFDGEADRNGRRNHDEIQFWSDYVSGGKEASYVRDDSGTEGGLGEGEPFTIVGDLNLDPNDGEGRKGAIRQLLEHPRIRDPQPASEGAERAAEEDGGANTSHDGEAGLDTADFPDDEIGNLRVDYVLPSSDLAVEEAGVFWPAPGSEDADLNDVSDHHLVWVDLTIDPN